MIQISPKQVQGWGRGGSMGSSLHPSYTQHTSGMIHATFRPERRRREGLYLPDVRRPTIPFCIFFVFLRFLKSLVLCDISCFAGAVLPPSQMVLFPMLRAYGTVLRLETPGTDRQGIYIGVNIFSSVTT